MLDAATVGQQMKSIPPQAGSEKSQSLGTVNIVADALPIDETQDVTKDLRDVQRERKRQRE